jgi:O-antigen/teichoic acid export membrane protein
MMPDMSDDSHRSTRVETGAQVVSGAHERHLASGAIAQQATMVISTLTMLGVVTALGRTLSLSEFGVYGVLISIPAYMLLAQASVEGAAVRAIAQSRDQLDRDRAYTTATVLYSGFGLLTALMVTFGGRLLLGVFDISSGLRVDAQLGLVLIGLVNLLAWPLKSHLDLLRGSQRFVPAALAEAIACVAFGALMGSAVALGEPLWIVAGVGGSMPLLIGAAATVLVLALRLPHRLRLGVLSLTYTRSFMSISAYLFISGIADLIIYALDRAVLGAFRPVATVGLYEGPIRAHNLVRQLQGTLVLTVMPASAAYLVSEDSERLRDLLVRGTRYVMLLTLPLTVTFMVLAAPILYVWLGPSFLPAASAMTILVGYWTIGAASAVGGAMLVAAGRVRLVAVYITCVAVFSLGLSLALTPPFGLDGLVLGTTIPNGLAVPVILWVYCRTFAVPATVLIREALLPAYLAGLAMAALELLGSHLLPVYRTVPLVCLVTVALAGYAAIVYRAWLRPSERLLMRTVLSGAVRRVASVRPAYRAL